MYAHMPEPAQSSANGLRIVGSPRIAPARPPEGPIDRTRCPGTRHGDYLAYAKAGCLCPDARYDIRCYRAAGAGRPLRACVDATGAGRRLRGLAHRRWAPTVVAHHAGLARQRVQDIRSGRAPRVQAATYLRIVEIAVYLGGADGQSESARRTAQTHEWYPMDAWVGDWIDEPSASPYLGHRRRLEALALDGWPLWAVARASAASLDDLVEVWAGRPASPGAGDAVVAAFEMLTGVGPSMECAEWARFRRFWPALAWDVDDIDDPTALASVGGPAADDEWWVDPIAVERVRLGVAQVGPWSVPQRQWLVADLTDRGRSAAEIVVLLGVSVRTVERDRAVIQARHTKHALGCVGAAAIAV